MRSNAAGRLAHRHRFVRKQLPARGNCPARRRTRTGYPPLHGTLQNLALRSSNQVELAIAQSDVLHVGSNFETVPSLEDKNSKKTWASIPFDKVELVSWLFSERLQVITSAHAYISSLHDLKGKRVWLGLPTSGAYATSGEVLRAAGVDPSQLDARQKQVHGYTEANEALLNGQLDAVFRITAVPMDFRRDLTPDEKPSTISELFRKGPEIRMLSLDQGLVDRLLEGSAYVEATIYRDTYPRLGSGVRTIGLGSILLTRQGLNPQEKDKVAALYRTLHSRRGQRRRNE
jgi:TRAP transporter TAXI family solute receptor